MGAVIAVVCAFSWSVSIILLKIAGTRIHPVVLNLGKNVLGFILLVPTAFVVEGPLPEISLEHWSLLMLSGFLGIGLADAMVLKAMTSLTASRIAVVECLYSPFMIALSVLFLNESLSPGHVIGGISIFVSLLLVLPQGEKAAATGSFTDTMKASIIMGTGILTMAVGVILVKPIFSEVPLFWIISIRMLAGVIGSFVIWLFMSDKKQRTLALFKSERPVLVMSAFFLSAYISISLWLAGYKYLQASVAAILNQTSTIFTVILAMIILRERLTYKKFFATILAAAGVVIATIF